MNDLVAVAIGGILALTGGFGVQLLNGRQAVKRRRHELIASFLTTLEAIRLRTFIEGHDSAEALREHKREIMTLHEHVSTVGHELALISDRATGLIVRMGIQAAILIWWTADPNFVDREEKFEVTDDFETTIETISERLYSMYGL